jgi:hypothetical protein
MMAILECKVIHDSGSNMGIPIISYQSDGSSQSDLYYCSVACLATWFARLSARLRELSKDGKAHFVLNPEWH